MTSVIDPGTIYNRQFYDLQQDGSLVSARTIMPEVIALTQASSLIDVGCGVGTWLRASQDCGISNLLGLDGDYVDRTRLFVDERFFSVCDLATDRLPDVAGARFDVALCLEVAEHLTAERAASFVSELCRLGDVVVFSAALPGQGGFNHINEQWPMYWADLFADQDFACFDILRPRLWDRDECEWWYLQNILVFGRIGSDAWHRLRQHGGSTATPASLIHPRNMRQKSEEFESVTQELQQLLVYQPFGRDEGIRVLEGKVDKLRELARIAADELSSARQSMTAERTEHHDGMLRCQQETDRLRQRIQAMEQSTSWRATRPLRALKTAADGLLRRR